MRQVLFAACIACLAGTTAAAAAEINVGGRKMLDKIAAFTKGLNDQSWQAGNVDAKIEGSILQLHRKNTPLTIDHVDRLCDARADIPLTVSGIYRGDLTCEGVELEIVDSVTSMKVVSMLLIYFDGWIDGWETPSAPTDEPEPQKPPVTEDPKR